MINKVTQRLLMDGEIYSNSDKNAAVPARRIYFYIKRTVLGLLLLAIVLTVMPFFFNAIERRPGILLHDNLLATLPSIDVSVYIFVIIWGAGLLLLLRSLNHPILFARFIWTYLFICFSRMLTIALVPLAPPVGLIPLTDPLTAIFYAEHAITKDLFYSGHTATLFVIYLCLEKQMDKLFALSLLSILVWLLLIQHIHYTIDIIAAPIIVYPLYQIVERKLLKPLDK